MVDERKLVCTYCSGPKRKDGGPLPAVERYLSGRITGLFEQARAAGDDFAILSGEFGLIEPGMPIPWYDHRLRADEVTSLAAQVADELLERQPTLLEYHTADPEAFPAVGPYREVMRRACRWAGVPLHIVILDGNPD